MKSSFFKQKIKLKIHISTADLLFLLREKETSGSVEGSEQKTIDQDKKEKKKMTWSKTNLFLTAKETQYFKEYQVCKQRKHDYLKKWEGLKVTDERKEGMKTIKVY